MYATIPNRKVLLIATLVALICSALVTISAISLRPVQEKNRLHYMHVNILEVAGLLQPGMDIKSQLGQLEAHLVNLDLGTFHDVEHPEVYDQRKAARDPEQSITLLPAQDLAAIKRRANFALVYLTRDAGNRIDRIILPIYGRGLWSTLYGFIAVRGDTNTVIGIRFYEHAETPGLGGEVDNARWLKQWRGKQVFDNFWRPAIRLVKGGLDQDDPQLAHKVDALSGATLTNRGIENIIKFWLGVDGFGPFLENVRESEGYL